MADARKDAASSDATFDIEDTAGNLLDTEDFISRAPSIVAPGEKGFFYTSMGGTSLNDKIIENGNYQFKYKLKINVSKEAPTSYAVSSLSLSADYFNDPQLAGRVTNTTSKEDSMLYVTAVFYGKDGHVLDLQGTNIFDFAPGETRSFEIPSYFIDGVDQIGSYEIIARPFYYQYNK